MKNITISVDEETHRLALVRAAEMDTSISALVRGYLTRLGDRSGCGWQCRRGTWRIHLSATQQAVEGSARGLRCAWYRPAHVGEPPQGGVAGPRRGKGRGRRRTRATPRHLRGAWQLAVRFIDTNVLLYAVSEFSEEAGKRTRTREVLTETGLAVSVQVVQEFFYQATRTTRIGANATSFGMHPDAGARVPLRTGHPHAWHGGGRRHRHLPPQTRLLQEAVARGCTVLDGLGMLVNQGVVSFRYWTGQDPDSSIMRAGLEEVFAE